MYLLNLVMAWGAESSGEFCHGPGGRQLCENFTYAGSLVEGLPPLAALEEVLMLQAELGDLPYPDHRAHLCGEEILHWIELVEEHFQSENYQAETLGPLVPTQNHIMANHDHIVQHCPMAWLMTLLLKIESNLDHAQRGLTCARVHTRGCLRDARGYWKLYVSMRQQLAQSSEFPEATDALLSGETRVVRSFHQIFAMR